MKVSIDKKRYDFRKINFLLGPSSHNVAIKTRCDIWHEQVTICREEDLKFIEKTTITGIPYERGPIIFIVKTLLGLYYINNLLLASKVPTRPEKYLDPKDVSAFYCDKNGIKNILSRSAAWIDETQLGKLYDDLHAEMNRFLFLIERRK